LRWNNATDNVVDYEDKGNTKREGAGEK
jgi:hypothetical protein